MKQTWIQRAKRAARNAVENIMALAAIAVLCAAAALCFAGALLIPIIIPAAKIAAIVAAVLFVLRLFGIV